jgi:hypothetical protein
MNANASDLMSGAFLFVEFNRRQTQMNADNKMKPPKQSLNDPFHQGMNVLSQRGGAAAAKNLRSSAVTLFK